MEEKREEKREEEREEEKEFPREFGVCRACGSTKTLAGLLLEQEREKGKVGKETIGAAQVFQSIIADPRVPSLSAPILIALIDICAECGTVRCIKAETKIGAVQATPKPGGPTMFKGMRNS